MLRRIGGVWIVMMMAACRGDRGAPPVAETVVDTTSAPSAVVTLAVPEPMAWNQEDTVVVALANRTATAIQGGRMTLFVQAPLSAVAPAAGTPGAPSVDSADGGTMITWELASVAQGAAIEMRQPVRTPPAPARAAGTPSFVVRATLLARGGAPMLAPVADTVSIRAGSEVSAGGCATAGTAPAQRYGIGPVRLGMTADALRAACPEARDTAWRAEGMAEKGLVVSLGGRAVVAQLVRDSVARVLAVSPELRTAAGVGIGSTLGDLRSRYGRLCAVEAEGKVAVWSPNAPGVSFGVEAPAAAAAPADSLPDEQRVASLWIHGQDTPCPARPEGNR
ncbi:MAG TPA: hypothetical protein VF613_17640 [Longimicrobium sp.]|jgi:hypothetical protein